LASASFAFSSEAFASGSCPNEAFRVGASAALPDCRAYEMVTPVFKNSGDVTNESAIVSNSPKVSSTGQSLMIWSTASFAGTMGNTSDSGSPYLLSRTPAGWVTTPLELPGSEYLTAAGISGAEFGWALDGRTGVLQARRVSSPGNTVDAYRVSADGSIVDVGSMLPPTAPAASIATLADSAGLVTRGVSADGSHVFFGISEMRWPFDESGAGWPSLYEYAGTGNTQPLLVGVDSSGKLISACGTMLGGVGAAPEINRYTPTEMNHNAISADGRTVFFTATKPEYACGAHSPAVNEVYARIDNGLPDAHTVAISEPTKEDCEQCNTTNGLGLAKFEGASADGSKVFFSTHQALLGSDNTQNIYEYDFNAPAGHRIVRVSGGDPVLSNVTAGVAGEPVQISEDGSHVYFVATGVLTRTPNSQGQLAQQGASNLYVFERDARYPEGNTAFIAALAPGDGDLVIRVTLVSGPTPLGADTTPDGRFLVFRSAGDLTPDDTSSVYQIFEYDSLTGRLVRVSIGQDGFKDNGNTNVYPAEIPSPREAFKTPRMPSDPRDYWSHMAVSADGAYVFFTSRDALAPGALEEQAHKGYEEELTYDYGPNVYEYHDGNVYLIAKATKTGQPLIGTDASGQDVFIATTEQLVGQDTDTNGDIYDARMGGGFPAPVTAPGCTGDACQGPLGGAPVLLSPGSEFQAGGNPPLASPQSAVRSAAKKKAKLKPKKKRKARKGAKSGRRRSKRGRK
jgi:hypothetical protein